MDLTELAGRVDRAEAALAEARQVYNRTNIESRDAAAVRAAEYLLRQAVGRLAKAKGTVDDVGVKDAAREAAIAAWRAARAPPSLPNPYYGNTAEVWAIFHAELEEWKYKTREGLFGVCPYL